MTSRRQGPPRFESRTCFDVKLPSSFTFAAAISLPLTVRSPKAGVSGQLSSPTHSAPTLLSSAIRTPSSKELSRSRGPVAL